MKAMVGVLAALIVLIFFAKQPKPRDVSDLPAPSDKVRGLLEQGRTVAAIRAYREQTGATLLEAHRVVGHHAS